MDDEIINPHPRFFTIAQNIRQRRGELGPVDIHLPKENSSKETIHMDAMAYGMGSCALQCTFGTESYDQARFLYDQFIPLAPLFMALSAASPIFKG